MNPYLKNSFDRFGDDLTELILQYLTFEDKVRLECVSKQWRRLVFNKQYAIEILGSESINYINSNNCGQQLVSYLGSISKEKNNSLNKLMIVRANRLLDIRKLNIEAFESVLKKCPNIKKVIIDFGIDSSVLSLIGRYCPRIKSLGYKTLNLYTNEDNALSFFCMYGHKLEELYLYGNDWVGYEIVYLRHCTNLKILMLMDSPLIYKQDEGFLPKLEEIRFPPDYLYIYNVRNVNELKIMTDKYSQTMKILNVSLGYLTAEEIKTCVECIARFENLKGLRLEIRSYRTEEPIDDCLSLIGQKCNKLLKLDLDIQITISDRFFSSLSEFKAIKKLKITLLDDIEAKGSIECFKHCKQLIELDITYDKKREDFFANIGSFVPKLQSLRITTLKQYSDSFIDSFHSMKYIQKVEHYNCEHIVWYFGKCLSNEMSCHNRQHIIRVNDNCGHITSLINQYNLMLHK